MSSGGGFKYITMALVVAVGISSGMYAFQPLFDRSHPEHQDFVNQRSPSESSTSISQTSKNENQNSP